MARLCPCTKRILTSSLLFHVMNTYSDATKADNSSGATKAGNSSVDEGSQGPSKCRRRKKSEMIRPFSCSVCGKKYGALYTHNKTKHGS